MKQMLVLAAVLSFVSGCSRNEEAVVQTMKLDICGEKTIVNPTEADIVSALSSLNTNSGDAFVILGPSDMTYIQASGDQNVGFDLEYQEGTTRQHYRATRESIPLNAIIEAFVAYRNENLEWKAKFTFERISL